MATNITFGNIAGQLLDSIEIPFPDFNGFIDPRFIEKEITYKQRIIRDAQEQLSKGHLQDLLNRGAYEDFYEQVLAIGRHSDNNLLYKGTPRSGNLALLHDEELDYEAFTNVFFNLLHGEGSGARLSNRTQLFL